MVISARPVIRRAAASAAVCLLVPLAACADQKTTTPVPATSPGVTSADGEFSRLRTQFGARLGVYALDTGSGRSVAFGADDRFAFCSTYKALAAAEVLRRLAPGDLDRRIPYTRADLVPNSPVTGQHTDQGMTLRDIIDAALRYSDNTAANLMLRRLGGPQGFEQDLRSIGDRVSQSDRDETALNEAAPGDRRDTGTPRMFATDLRTYVLGTALPPDMRDLLTDMLRRNTTGDGLIRAGVPDGWVVGDKTGSGQYGTRNDIAVLWPPNRAPLVLAIMSTHDQKDAGSDSALIAAAAKAAVGALT